MTDRCKGAVRWNTVGVTSQNFKEEVKGEVRSRATPSSEEENKSGKSVTGKAATMPDWENRRSSLTSRL